MRSARHRRRLVLTALLLLASGAGLADAAAECLDEATRPDGSVRLRLFRDCADGSFLAEVRYDRHGNPRMLIDRRDGRSFRALFGRTGSAGSGRYVIPAGLDVRFGARRASIGRLGPVGGTYSILGLRLFLGPASLTHYDLHGAPAQRVELDGRPSVLPTAVQPAVRTDDYGQAFEATIRAAHDRGEGSDGVFFGDSIVQHLVSDPDQRPYWTQLQGGHRLLSAAIAGDRIRHALGRTWAIAPTAKLVAIQIGSNDHDGGHGNPNDTAEGIAGLVARAIRLAPEAVIVLIAIPPTTESARHEKNRITSELMATLADGDRVRMIDPSPPLDMSNPEHSTDGLHFTPAGAALWYGAIAPVFAEILGR